MEEIELTTIFLDFDGTLVDVMPRFHAIFSEYLTQKGYPSPDVDEYRRLKQSHSYDPEIFKVLGFEIDWKDYRTWKMERVESLDYLRLDRLIGDPHQVIAQIRQKGYSVVLLSARMEKENLMLELKWLGIHDLFDSVIVTERYEEDSKARALAGLVGEGDIIVGDSETEVIASRELGIKHFGVATGLRSPGFLFEQGARVVLRDYTVLPELL